MLVVNLWDLLKLNGSIDRYKAKLVIKVYKQKEGLDFFDTYSPVMRIHSNRMVVTIATLQNLKVHQMDVKKFTWNNSRGSLFQEKKI